MPRTKANKKPAAATPVYRVAAAPVYRARAAPEDDNHQYLASWFSPWRSDAPSAIAMPDLRNTFSSLQIESLSKTFSSDGSDYVIICQPTHDLYRFAASLFKVVTHPVTSNLCLAFVENLSFGDLGASFSQFRFNRGFISAISDTVSGGVTDLSGHAQGGIFMNHFDPSDFDPNTLLRRHPNLHISDVPLRDGITLLPWFDDVPEFTVSDSTSVISGRESLALYLNKTTYPAGFPITPSSTTHVLFDSDLVVMPKDMRGQVTVSGNFMIATSAPVLNSVDIKFWSVNASGARAQVGGVPLFQFPTDSASSRYMAGASGVSFILDSYIDRITVEAVLATAGTTGVEGLSSGLKIEISGYHHGCNYAPVGVMALLGTSSGQKIRLGGQMVYEVQPDENTMAITGLKTAHSGNFVDFTLAMAAMSSQRYPYFYNSKELRERARTFDFSREHLGQMSGFFSNLWKGIKKVAAPVLEGAKQGLIQHFAGASGSEPIPITMGDSPLEQQLEGTVVWNSAGRYRLICGNWPDKRWVESKSGYDLRVPGYPHTNTPVDGIKVVVGQELARCSPTPYTRDNYLMRMGQDPIRVDTTFSTQPRLVRGPWVADDTIGTYDVVWTILPFEDFEYYDYNGVLINHDMSDDEMSEQIRIALASVSNFTGVITIIPSSDNVKLTGPSLGLAVLMVVRGFHIAGPFLFTGAVSPSQDSADYSVHAVGDIKIKDDLLQDGYSLIVPKANLPTGTVPLDLCVSKRPGVMEIESLIQLYIGVLRFKDHICFAPVRRQASARLAKLEAPKPAKAKAAAKKPKARRPKRSSNA